VRTIAIATVSAMALMSVSAFAQTPSPAVHPMTPGTPGTAPATRAAVPQPNPLQQADVSKIIGTSVYGSDGKEIGDVSTVLMKPDKKQIDRLVVRSGGVLGIGGRHVALPLDQFSWNATKGVLTVSKTGKEIDKMAEWKAPSSTSSSATTGVGSSLPPSHKTSPASNSGR
jgi:sporulation protein YlmC with PRC-barrel domain